MASPDTNDQTKKEATASSPETDLSDQTEKSSPEKLECAVCLQTCIRPVRLPCSHIFCYLCVKGVVHQSKKCAMCRRPIPSNYLDNPSLISAEHPTLAFEGSYQWFYEGKNGWWQYDERTSTEIEAAYQSDEKQYEVLIAGFLYVIDFENNIQMRRNDPFRRRKIKRDLVSIPKKGVAGIRLVSQPDASEDVPCVQNLDLSQADNSCCSPAKSASSSDEGSSSAPGPSMVDASVQTKEMKAKQPRIKKQNITCVSPATPCPAVVVPATVNVPLPAATSSVIVTPKGVPAVHLVNSSSSNAGLGSTLRPVMLIKTPNGSASLTVSSGCRMATRSSVIIHPTGVLPCTVMNITPGSTSITIVTNSQEASSTCRCGNKRSSSDEPLPEAKKH